MFHLCITAVCGDGMWRSIYIYIYIYIFLQPSLDKSFIRYWIKNFFSDVNDGDVLTATATSETSSEMNKLSTPQATEDLNDTPDQLVPWKVKSGGQFTLVTSWKKIPQDGRSFLSLHGSISQIFNTTQGSHYQIVFFASHVIPSQDPLVNQEGRIEAPGLNRVFKLYNRPASSHSDQTPSSIQWHEHRFYFTATEDLSTLTISSVGRSNGILLDNIQVLKKCIHLCFYSFSEYGSLQKENPPATEVAIEPMTPFPQCRLMSQPSEC